MIRPIEITPTEPISYTSGVALDGNSDLWDAPLFPYLDGNWKEPVRRTTKLGSKYIIGKHNRRRPVITDTKPYKYYTWIYKVWTEVLVTTYIDGNKILYQGSEVNYLERADGNVDLYNCIGLIQDGEYVGAGIKFQAEGMTFYKDGIIFGATEPVEPVRCLPRDEYPIGYVSPIPEHEPEIMSDHYPYINRGFTVAIDRYHLLQRYTWNEDYDTFDLSEPFEPEGTPGVVVLGMKRLLVYGPTKFTVFMVKYKNEIWCHVSIQSFMEKGELIIIDPEYLSPGITLCEQKPKVVDYRRICNWDLRIPRCDALKSTVLEVGSTIDMRPHLEQGLKMYRKGYWYTLEYAYKYTYRVVKATHTTENVYNKLIVTNPLTSRVKF